MKWIISISFFLICFVQLALSQWEPINSNSEGSIYAVQFLSESEGYFCGGDGIHKTTDGGNNWDKMDFLSPDSLYLNGCIFYGLHFFNSITGVVVGYVFWDNAEIILRTNDSGLSWTIVHLGGFDSALNDVFFIDQNNGFAVGKNGRILKTTNAGVNWSALGSGTTETLNSIDFSSVSQGCIAGENTMLYTNNAGFSWNESNFPIASFYDVNYASSTIAYAVGNNGLVIKTYDSGISWEVSETLVNDELNNVWFISVDTGFVCTHDGYLLTTNSGGLFWEKQMVDEILFTLYFYNSQVGYAGGFNGVLLKTTNQGGWSYPMASFYTDAITFCPDSTIDFINNGPDSYTYQWQYNGNPVSSEQHYSRTFSSSNKNDTISLLAYNSLLYDTAEMHVYVEPSLEIDLLTSISNDTICPNTEVYFSVINSENGVVYQLKYGNTIVGNPQNGNGDTLLFGSGNIVYSSTFKMEATKTNDCGFNEVFDFIEVVVLTPDISLDVYSTTPMICIYDSAQIFIESTEFETTYQLHNGNGLIGDVLQGSGATIQLNTGSLFEETIFSVYATNSLGCSEFLTETQNIEIRLLDVEFTVSPQYAFVGDVISFNNMSNADSYFWEFDSTASILSDTLIEPTVIYNSVGEKTIFLTGYTTVGCVDSSEVNIHIFQHPPQSNGASCFFDTISQVTYPYYWQGHILDYHVDIAGNSYVGGCYHHNYGIDGKDLLFLRKYKPDGILDWEEVQDPFDYTWSYYNYQSSFVTGITTDEELNVYITGSYANDEFKLDGITVSNTIQEFSTQFYIAKLDSNGVAQWIIYSDQPNTKEHGGTDILYAGDNQIYVSIFKPTTGYFPDGSTHSLNGEIAILKIDSDGHYINHSTIGPGGYDYHHISFLNPNNSSYYTYRIATVSPKLEMGNNGNIFVFGKFSDYLTFGSIQVNQIDEYMNAYVAILNPNNNWEDAFALYGRDGGYSNYGNADVKAGVFPIFTLDDDENIYVSDYCGIGNTYYDTVNLIFNTGEEIRGVTSSMLAKYDNVGNLLWYNKNISMDVSGMSDYSNDEILLLGEYKDFAGVFSQDTEEYGIESVSGKDITVVSMDTDGNTNWVDKLGSSGADDAFFLEKNSCGELYFLGNIQEYTTTAYDTLNYSGDHLFVLHFAPNGDCVYGCDTVTVLVPNHLPQAFNEVDVYPNPAQDEIFIKTNLKLKEVNVYSMQGKLLIQGAVNEENHIHLKSLSNGVYLMEIVSTNKKYYRKIVKE